MKATVIFDSCREGSLNMALDSLLLQQLREEEQVFLRFYTWCPPTISIGLFQKWEQACSTSYPVVRRPTGGKAVLHLGDLSYAFVGPLAGFGNSVLETYYLVSQGLIKGLELLGVPAEFLPAPLPGKDDPASCFVQLSGHEVGVAGKKLIGSAQARKPWGFLQHGSIMVEPIYRETAELFGVQESQVKAQAISLREIVPDITLGVLENALREGFEDALDLHFTRGELSSKELSQAASFSRKYAVCS
ncbi:MAG TPA: lipoate--protein ligase family protein [Coprothermobacter sp.]|nr:lipoate--protein ligase family protein [Coprothermobacter sp.]